MTDTDLTLDLEELVSAEDFLNYFDIAFDQTVVHVNRLHILQRFHNYLTKEPITSGRRRLARAVHPPAHQGVYRLRGF